jgi:hypothetical protein
MRHPMTSDSDNINRQKNEQKHQHERKANRTFSTFDFARHTIQRFAKPKGLNFYATNKSYYDNKTQDIYKLSSRK